MHNRITWLFGGLLLGALAAAGTLWAQKRPGDSPIAAVVAAGGAGVEGPFDIVDTPGSTYLLNRSSGQVWRLSFTDVGGSKYWYALHVPVQQPGTFEEFQARLKKGMQGN